VSTQRGELVWAGITDSFNPSAVNKAIDRLVKLVIRPMQREVLYRRLVYTAQELSRRSDANLRFAPVAARALDHEDISTFEA